MAYDIEAFLRHLIAGGDRCTPDSYLDRGVAGRDVPEDFRAFVQELLDHSLIEDTMRRRSGVRMSDRVRVTPLGLQMIGG
jgi:hypothetical protein